MWTIGWFLVASRIEARPMPETLARDHRREMQRPDAENAEVRGYPFRFGFVLSNPPVPMHAPSDGVTAHFRRRSAPPRTFYRPGHVVAEIDGPLGSHCTRTLTPRVDWQSLQTSVQATTDGVSRGSGIDGPTT